MKPLFLWLGEEASFFVVMGGMMLIVGVVMFFGLKTLIDIREYWP